MNRLSIIMMMLLAVISCSSTKEDGIYKTEYGWEIIEEGKTYDYRCESDGLYLYIDWEGRKFYDISFRYSSPIYRRTVGHESDYSNTTLNFLTKNKDGKYVYVANYTDFDGCFYNIKSIGFDTDKGRTESPYEHIKQYVSLLEKYVQ